ncbi:MAG: prolipoprotein diacylglyceryl transferase [Thermonema sp.]|uniref:prolipoprotein diacylglyceryl transferase n=1 Tax=Thermonema sp. TaxID=2231181 RepID=UPI0021DC3DBB|nr:prolipoprotein diacylglyceryl transferase [Thermonema sp.]GIV39260.1 MAG: prolipoprotein diacylglyceryl transferase [Thermonema sp.]
MDLLFIRWDVDPAIVEIFGREIRWYGLMFAIAFLLGSNILAKIFKIEGKPEKDLDKLTVYVIIATIVGARLGHCLFYQPDYYLSNPVEILKIWEGGLASHGAAIGILTALYLYSRSRPDQPFLWVTDRVVIPVALGGGFVRLGNLMNSEIVGKPTDLPWGFIFVRNGEDFARHPAQIYESLFYFFTFYVLWRIYQKHQSKLPQGALLGLFLVMVFGFRFLVEFVKDNQVPFEDQLPLNMGQILSIPAVLGGLWLMARAWKKDVNTQI